jgi:hypothetical protein
MDRLCLPEGLYVFDWGSLARFWLIVILEVLLRRSTDLFDSHKNHRQRSIFYERLNVYWHNAIGNFMRCKRSALEARVLGVKGGGGGPFPGSPTSPRTSRSSLSWFSIASSFRGRAWSSWGRVAYGRVCYRERTEDTTCGGTICIANAPTLSGGELSVASPQFTSLQETVLIRQVYFILKGKYIAVTGGGGSQGCETSRLPHFFRQSAHWWMYGC